ncbi:apolipoprotein R-like [Dasypus novemcinctus]|uniref:apolipoprotein R-like n=1 Tax=Dasypus novemcinctus TaxID=9361 RepID=UPI000328AE29|nr:apolipoprotein R-like [Dasypus novemcinctus]
MKPSSGSSEPALCLLGVLALLLCPPRVHGCSSYPRVKHGHVREITKRASRMSWVTYECDEGYKLVGVAKIPCPVSKWSPAVPQCKALCLKPRIPNGRLSVEKEQYVNPETITVQCDPGYRMVGSQNISCSENKIWSPEVPKCEKEVLEGHEMILAGREMILAGHEMILAGKNLLNCLPNPQDTKMALELYKLSQEIKNLEKKRDEEKEPI